MSKAFNMYLNLSKNLSHERFFYAGPFYCPAFYLLADFSKISQFQCSDTVFSTRFDPEMGSWSALCAGNLDIPDQKILQGQAPRTLACLGKNSTVHKRTRPHRDNFSLVFGR
jgi:hypothetical protein